MKRTNLRGHALRAEGAPHERDRITGAWQRVTLFGWSAGGAGVGLCQCGAASPVLDSAAKRKAWHARHKDEVRAKAGEGQ